MYRYILSMVLCLTLVSNGFCAMSIDNYFDHPLGSSSKNNILQIYGTQNIQSGGTLNILSGSTLAVAGTVTYTAAPTFSAGIDVDEDVDIDFDARDEEFNITTSSQGLITATIYNSSTDLIEDSCLLSLDLKDNGDAEGRYLQCRDNSSANTVMQIGSDGAITIDVSGGGSGTVLSEATFVSNDAAFDFDSETQDINIGDGSNDVNFTDNGVMTFAGTAYIDSETNDLEIGDGTNQTVFSDNGCITQSGDANAAFTEVTIAGTGLTLNSFSVLADSDTLTISSNTVNLCTKAGAMEVDLPDAATSTGKIFTFKKTDADASIVTIDANGGTIDGADPYTSMDAQYDCISIISDGTNWHIIAEDIN